MPRIQELVVCPKDVWTELTNSNTSAVTFQVISGSIEVRGTAGAVPPAANSHGYRYHAHVTSDQEGQNQVKLVLTDFAVGANRLYARPINGRVAKVVVDHA
jgi:hypothetical protein